MKLLKTPFESCELSGTGLGKAKMAASMKAFFVLGYNYYNLSNGEVTSFQTPLARGLLACVRCVCLGNVRAEPTAEQPFLLELTNRINLRNFPMLYLLNGKGKIVLKNTSLEAIKAKLDTL